MLERTDLEGLWWLPNTPDARAPGIATFEPELGVTLRLNGSLTEEFNLRSSPVIHGMTANGELISLLGCSQASRHIGSGGYETESFSAAWLLAGEHFSDIESVSFDTMNVRITNMEAFIGGVPFVRSYLPWSITVQEQTPCPTALLGDFSVNVDHRFTMSGKRLVRETLEHRAAFEISSDAPRPLTEYLKLPIRSLLTLCDLMADGRQAITEMTGFSRSAEQDAPEPERHSEVRIFFKQWGAFPMPDAKELYALPFTAHSLGIQWADCLRRWHEARLRFGPTFDHFFSFNRTRDIAVEHQFLHLTQALESYHRRAFPERTHEPTEDFRARRDRICARLETGDAEWLKPKLSNDASFKIRIGEIFDLAPSDVAVFLGPKDAFADKVAATRNYLTHFDEERKKKAWIKGPDLWAAVIRLSTLLRLCFLRELALDARQTFQTPWGQRICSQLQSSQPSW